MQQPRLQPVARLRRESQPELLDRRRRSRRDRRSCWRARRAGRCRQLLPEIRGGDLVRLQQRFAQGGVLPRRSSPLPSCSGSDRPTFWASIPHRVLKADLLVQLEELEDVAADAAAEAVEEPLLADRRETTASSRSGTDRAPCRSRPTRFSDTYSCMTCTMLACRRRSSMNVWGKSAYAEPDQIRASEFASEASTTRSTPPPPCSGGAGGDVAPPADAACRNPAMRALQLARAVSVDQPDRSLIAEQRLVQEPLGARQRFVHGAADHVQLGCGVVSRAADRTCTLHLWPVPPAPDRRGPADRGRCARIRLPRTSRSAMPSCSAVTTPSSPRPPTTTRSPTPTGVGGRGGEAGAPSPAGSRSAPRPRPPRRALPSVPRRLSPVLTLRRAASSASACVFCLQFRDHAVDLACALRAPASRVLGQPLARTSPRAA